MLAAASEGMGLAILPWYVARESIADASVRPVLADHGLPAQDMHAAFPSRKLVPSKVTSFIEPSSAQARWRVVAARGVGLVWQGESPLRTER